MITVGEIYSAINRRIPFSSAEKWDNCGLLAGDPKMPVTKVLTALDITCDVIREAEEKGAELIVSHHPVIFTPLKAVTADTPTGMLLSKGISAICTHTPFDMAECGMNKGLYELLREPLGLCGNPVPLEATGENTAIGMIYDTERETSAAELAGKLKSALGCTCVRYTASDRIIRKIAVSSGSGNSFVQLASQKGADCLVSGDFKHDSFIDAKNMDFPVFDCGHFHTERIFTWLMRDILLEELCGIEVIEAESCTDPVSYMI